MAISLEYRISLQFNSFLTYCSHKPECIGTTNPGRSVLITIITWHSQFHPVNVSNLRVKGAYVLEASPFHALLPLLRHVVRLNDGNCHLTIPVVKGRCAREVLPHAFDIGVFKYGRSNHTTIKHIYNGSENLHGSCDVAFDSNNWWNLPWTVPVIGVESMVTRAGLRYTRDYLTPGICRLIKPAAMEKMMSFRAKIHTVNYR